MHRAEFEAYVVARFLFRRRDCRETGRNLSANPSRGQEVRHGLHRLSFSQKRIGISLATRVSLPTLSILELAMAHLFWGVRNSSLRCRLSVQARVSPVSMPDGRSPRVVWEDLQLAVESHGETVGRESLTRHGLGDILGSILPRGEFYERQEAR